MVSAVMRRHSLGSVLTGSGTLTMRRQAGQGACLPARLEGTFTCSSHCGQLKVTVSPSFPFSWAAAAGAGSDGVEVFPTEAGGGTGGFPAGGATGEVWSPGRAAVTLSAAGFSAGRDTAGSFLEGGRSFAPTVFSSAGPDGIASFLVGGGSGFSTGFGTGLAAVTGSLAAGLLSPGCGTVIGFLQPAQVARLPASSSLTLYALLQFGQLNSMVMVVSVVHGPGSRVVCNYPPHDSETQADTPANPVHAGQAARAG